jgi:hypothetical protein
VELGRHRGRGRGEEKIARIAMIAKTAGIEEQRLTPDYADERRSKRAGNEENDPRKTTFSPQVELKSGNR